MFKFRSPVSKIFIYNVIIFFKNTSLYLKNKTSSRKNQNQQTIDDSFWMSLGKFYLTKPM